MTFTENGVPLLTPEEVSRVTVTYGSPEADARHKAKVDAIMRRIQSGELKRPVF